MSTVLSIYTKNAYKEYQLPAVKNEDYDLIISGKIFSLQEDIELRLEAINGRWKPKSGKRYILTKENGNPYEYFSANDVLQMTTYQEEQLSIVVMARDDTFFVMKKYDISKLNQVSIGSAGENDICYNFQELVSRKHAVLKKETNGWLVEDLSLNGIFVNETRIDHSYHLEVGDCISIYGLKIIYLNGRIAICAVNHQVTVSNGLLPLHFIEDGKKRASINFREDSEKHKYFHRSPRSMAVLETEPICIENPPMQKVISKKPLFLTIGPSFTMMIPMLLGSLLAMYSSRASGANMGAFMYTGIIMAVGSAILGVFWALVNIQYEKKTTVEEEEKRFQGYSEYLLQQVERIKKVYEQSRKALLEQYPDGSACLSYNETNPALWSRNRGHEDFLSHRLGLGNLPFQVPIEVSKEKFSMAEDKLMQKPSMIQKEYQTLYDVPILIELKKHSVIGLIGGLEKKGAVELMHVLSAQIAANNAYTDVKLVYIYDKKKHAQDWSFAKWLPHVWSEDRKIRYVASDRAEASDVFYELVKTFRVRSEESENRKEEIPKPYYIMFIEDASVLEGELITKYILNDLPNLGLTSFFMAESYEQLPNQCDYAIQNDSSFQGIYDLKTAGQQEIKFDHVSAEELEQMARRISGIEINEAEKGGDIPNSLSFFEMFHVQRPEELNAQERWRKNRNYENMRAEVGVKAGGELCYLDVHEKYHGPHGLVAGTTGSGKSETLQTYMLSLALNFSPDDVNFFIIDYKGGGMANLFNGLPHMIGQISNLSGNQVNRAMISIKSENKRRQRIFNEHNVNNINLYTKLYKSGEASIPVPHLFIIIDEFAELKREEADFMKELISVAQVGRSLGVHLILATQKPSGTVDDNIWSNSKFRLCLRVQDRQDSNDMLHKPDAAYITQAGRCYLQVGNDELYELFQSGYSGAPYNANAEMYQSGIASMISLTGKMALIGNRLKRRQQDQMRATWIGNLIQIMQQTAVDRNQSMQELAESEDAVSAVYKKLAFFEVDYPENEYNAKRLEELMQTYVAISKIAGEEQQRELKEEVEEVIKCADENHIKLPEQKVPTQLEAMVEYLAKTAKEAGYNHKFQLWMPLLSTSISLEELDGYSKNTFDGKNWPTHSGEWKLEVPIGLCDDPVSQAQMPLLLNLSEGGHHALCGMIVSGKSTLMQTIIYALIQTYSPEYINVYGIDFSSHMLSAFEHAPHVGGIVYEDEQEKIEKFFHMMQEMLEARKKLFRGGNYSQYVHSNGIKVPAVVVAIDNYTSFKEKTDNKYEEVLMHIAHDGVGYGIYLILTAGGFGTNEIQTRIGDNMKTVICLQMNDRFQYADAMRVPRVEVLPETNIKGRGIAKVGDRILEFQSALSIKAEDDYKRIEAIDNDCKKMRENWNGKCARLIPVLPEKPVWSEFVANPEVQELIETRQYLPFGYDMESADVYGIDLSKIYCYVVSGKARTGKTNAMKALISSAVKFGGDVTVLELSGDDLQTTAQNTGANYITTQKDQGEFFKNLIPLVQERNQIKKDLIANGKEEEIFSKMQELKPSFIFISDLTDFVEKMHSPEDGVLNIRPFLENLTEKGKQLGIYFFVSLNQDSASSVMGLRTYENVTGYHTGVHFGGNVANLRYMDFSYLNYTEQSRTEKPGIAMLPLANEESTRKILVPLVKG
ncbi:type VII secretion protein EssC [Brotaphodocola sp.]|uniref:type VII secretion protein EssC n=1 Tax=Brotaphodocola sp. TaxID=3073577 RepID=UPI003D7CDB35